MLNINNPRNRIIYPFKDFYLSVLFGCSFEVGTHIDRGRMCYCDDSFW